MLESFWVTKNCVYFIQSGAEPGPTPGILCLVERVVVSVPDFRPAGTVDQAMTSLRSPCRALCSLGPEETRACVGGRLQVH